MTCTHDIARHEYLPDDWDGYGSTGEWRYWRESTTEDIDLGRYKCTQCNKIMYYTGLWREHHEGGRKLLDERTGCVKSSTKEKAK